MKEVLIRARSVSLLINVRANLVDAQYPVFFKQTVAGPFHNGPLT